MGFGEDIAKGLDDAFRMGSNELDRIVEQGRTGDITKEIDSIKKDLGTAVFVSYVKGEPVDERYIEYCKRIEFLVSKLNEASSRQNSGRK